MLSKIYYGLGIGVIALYLLVNLLSWRSSASGATQAARPIGKMRMEYYIAPSTSYPPSSGGSYSSGSGSNPYSSGSKSSGSRSSSYPSSGGSSGGK